MPGASEPIEATPDGTVDWISTSACLAPLHAAGVWCGDELKHRIARLAARLRSSLPAGTVVGSLADNSPHWLVADLALQAAGMVHVPLPSFFTGEQIAHAMRASAMAAIFCTDASLAEKLGFAAVAIPDDSLGCYTTSGIDVPHPPPTIDKTVTKITFTSGTTGTPKGVMLCTDHQLATARSLAAATSALGIERHLCLLPLPVLLENVAGAYTALLSGATCLIPGLADTGMQGASGFDAHRCLDLVGSQRADSLILLPQMLHAIVGALETQVTRSSAPTSLKFVAVGGARTPPALIARARRLGLPVFEGYGLSECASVVSLNVPCADRLGSVGRALPGVGIRLANDGEVEVRGRGFAGYLGTSSPAPDAWFATGDLGTLDESGHLAIVGRKNDVLVTSFGRNVSPEWPEGLIVEHPGILQAAVFGDARPFLVAVVVAVARLSDTAIDAHIASINARLPDYARIEAWIRANEPFTPANGLTTPNGRIRRPVVHSRYAANIAALYGDAPNEPMPEPFAPAHA